MRTAVVVCLASHLAVGVLCYLLCVNCVILFLCLSLYCPWISLLLCLSFVLSKGEFHLRFLHYWLCFLFSDVGLRKTLEFVTGLLFRKGESDYLISPGSPIVV